MVVEVMPGSAAEPAAPSSLLGQQMAIPILAMGVDQRVVQLTTGPQAAGNYTIVSITATDLGGTSSAG